MLRHLLLSREAVRVCPIVPNTLHFAVPTPTGPSSPCHQVNVPSPTERVGDRPVEWALNTLSGDSDGLLEGFPFSYRGQRKRWWTPSGGRDPLQVRRGRGRAGSIARTRPPRREWIDPTPLWSPLSQGKVGVLQVTTLREGRTPPLHPTSWSLWLFIFLGARVYNGFRGGGFWGSL